MTAAIDEPDRDDEFEGDHLHLAPEDGYGSMTPAIRGWREHLTDRKRRNALIRVRQASDDKVKAERMAAESARRASQASVGFEGDQIALDPRSKRRISLPLAVLAAIAVAAVDGLPAYWASEALGHGVWPTTMVAMILVAALAGFAVLMTYFGHEGKKLLFWTAAFLAVAMIGVQTALRVQFLIVTSGATWTEAGLEGGLLAAITLSLVWVGYIVLDRAEPFGMWRQRCAVRKLDREAARWEREADAAGSRYFSAMEGLEHIERGRMGQRAQLERDIEGFVQLGVLPPDIVEALRRAASEKANADKKNSDAASEADPRSEPGDVAA